MKSSSSFYIKFIFSSAFFAFVYNLISCFFIFRKTKNNTILCDDSYNKILYSDIIEDIAGFFSLFIMYSLVYVYVVGFGFVNSSWIRVEFSPQNRLESDYSRAWMYVCGCNLLVPAYTEFSLLCVGLLVYCVSVVLVGYMCAALHCSSATSTEETLPYTYSGFSVFFFWFLF